MSFIDIHVSFLLNKTVQIFETFYLIPTPIALKNSNLVINVAQILGFNGMEGPGGNICSILLPPGCDASPSQA